MVAAGHYCYAVFKESKEVYSWGMGENFVLGNRDDCNLFTPYCLDPMMFEENTCIMMACGTMHAVALAKDSTEAALPELNQSLFPVVTEPEPVPKPVVKPKTEASPAKVNGDHQDEVRSQESKKRSREEFLESHAQNAEIGSAVKRLKIEELPMQTIPEQNDVENGEAME